MFLTKKFPELYQGLIPDVLAWEVPDESFANCSQCHLASTDKKSLVLTKCCTYHATLPNYIVGAILQEEGAAWQLGKQRVEQKIAARVGVTPYGIVAPLEFEALKKARLNEGKMNVLPFDERQQLTCPYLDKGKCTVWKYRSELCITYFCNSVGGSVGKQFWGSLYKYVREVERKLSLYALQQIGYSGKLYMHQLKEDSFPFKNAQGAFNEPLYRGLWRKYLGQEIALYKKCYEVIAALSPVQVKEILGWDTAWLLEETNNFLATFKKQVLPLYAKFDNTVKVLKKGNNQYILTTTEGKSVGVGQRGLMTLKQFDGTKNIQDILREHHGMLPINDEKYSLFLKVGILKPVQNTAVA